MFYISPSVYSGPLSGSLLSYEVSSPAAGGTSLHCVTEPHDLPPSSYIHVCTCTGIHNN